MKTLTSTELRTKSNSAYNAVMKDGAVNITHRDRPPMVLISLEEFNKRLAGSKK